MKDRIRERIEEITSVIPRCKVFADVGCDHGYAAEKALKSGRCEKAVVSDVSEKCLMKARSLLSDYIAKGRAIAVLSDGFKNLPPCDVALIAGMGGEEIAKIISDAAKDGYVLPETLVLQPMKNADKVRALLAESGYRLEKDYLFYVGDKYYFLIKAVRGADVLSDEEREFGRTNVNELPPDFIRYVKEELGKFAPISAQCGETGCGREKIDDKIKRLKKYVDS